MGRILFEAATKLIKRNLTKAVKIVRNPSVLKNALTKKNLANKLNPIRVAQKKMTMAQKMGRLTRIALSPKARAIERLTHKAMILEQLTSLQYDKGGDVINFVPQTSATATEINKTTNFLKGKSKPELKAMEEVLNKDLKEGHLDNAEQIANVVRNEEALEDLIKTNTYEQFMDNGKTAFYESDTTAYMTQDEKDQVGSEIEQEKDFGGGEDRDSKYSKSKIIKENYENLEL